MASLWPIFDVKTDLASFAVKTEKVSFGHSSVFFFSPTQSTYKVSE